MRLSHRFALPAAFAAGVSLTLVLAAASPRGEAPRRCVGMFVDAER
jgi:hypothetical protein